MKLLLKYRTPTGDLLWSAVNRYVETVFVQHFPHLAEEPNFFDGADYFHSKQNLKNVLELIQMLSKYYPLTAPAQALIDSIPDERYRKKALKRIRFGRRQALLNIGLFAADSRGETWDAAQEKFVSKSGAGAGSSW